MDATTGHLVEFASQSGFAGLAQETVHECKRRLIDTFACAFGAYEDPLSRMARNVAARYRPAPQAPEARVWGCAQATTPEAAAFANGVMLRVLDLNDMYGAKGAGHPSDVSAGIFAVGDAVHAHGADVIAAVTLAYDVYCTLCESVDLGSKGWDQPVYVSIASALAIGTLLQLTREQLGNAVALALAPNMALYQTRRGEISSWKGAAAANASRNAVFAALLAREGFAGPTAIFEGECGLWDAIGTVEWRLDAGQRSSHRISRTNMKCFPICYHGQSAVWAAIDLKPRVELDAVAEIRIETYRAAIKLMANDPSRWSPATRDTADHSLPYVVAIALLDGELNSDSFASDRLSDPRVAALMKKTKVFENADFNAGYPETAPSRVTLCLSSGESLTGEVAYSKGHIKNPMSDSDLERKFRGLFQRYGDETQCESILHRLWEFERIPNVADMAALFLRPHPI